LAKNLAVAIILEALVTDVAVAAKVELALSIPGIRSAVRVLRVAAVSSGGYRSVGRVSSEFSIFNNDC